MSFRAAVLALTVAWQILLYPNRTVMAPKATEAVRAALEHITQDAVALGPGLVAHLGTCGKRLVAFAPPRSR